MLERSIAAVNQFYLICVNTGWNNCPWIVWRLVVQWYSIIQGNSKQSISLFVLSNKFPLKNNYLECRSIRLLEIHRAQHINKLHSTDIYSSHQNLEQFHSKINQRMIPAIWVTYLQRFSTPVFHLSSQYKVTIFVG